MVHVEIEELEGPDPARARLRAVVAAVNRQMLLLPAREAQAGGQEGLMDAWNELVGLLDLGPAPALRRCARCTRVGRRDASLCAYCWSPLEPLAATPSAQPGG